MRDRLLMTLGTLVLLLAGSMAPAISKTTKRDWRDETSEGTGDGKLICWVNGNTRKKLSLGTSAWHHITRRIRQMIHFRKLTKNLMMFRRKEYPNGVRVVPSHWARNRHSSKEFKRFEISRTLLTTLHLPTGSPPQELIYHLQWSAEDQNGDVWLTSKQSNSQSEDFQIVKLSLPLNTQATNFIDQANRNLWPEGWVLLEQQFLINYDGGDHVHQRFNVAKCIKHHQLDSNVRMMVVKSYKGRFWLAFAHHDIFFYTAVVKSFDYERDYADNIMQLSAAVRHYDGDRLMKIDFKAVQQFLKKIKAKHVWYHSDSIEVEFASSSTPSFRKSFKETPSPSSPIYHSISRRQSDFVDQRTLSFGRYHRKPPRVYPDEE